MKSRYYDLQHIKAIPIGDYLHAYGIEPVKRYNGYALYHAPYREDPNASLKVDFRQKLWYDYGTSQGGSIIDLVMRIRECSAYEAMVHLAGRKATTLSPSSFHREAHTERIRGGQQLSNVTSNARRILFISEELPLYLQNYLREVRRIDLTVASPYLCHIRYEVGGREYSAIGFANRAGGYELRDDKTFKGTIAPKDISVIAGEANNSPYCIFEGFMDFLSYLTMKGKEIAPCLVLNSVSNLSRAIAYLCEHHITSVRAFLDNDQAGRQALQSLQSAGIKVEDMSRHYVGHKDFNEYHVARYNHQQEAQQVKPIIVKRKLR